MISQESRNNFWLGLIAMAIGITYALCIPYQVSDYSDGYNITGRTFPEIIAGLMILTGSLLSAQSCYKHWRQTQNKTPCPEEDTPSCSISKAACTRIALYIALIGVYILALIHVGFLISTAGALWCAMRLSRADNPKVMLIISIVGSVLLYAFFTLAMDVYFPTGWLW